MNISKIDEKVIIIKTKNETVVERKELYEAIRKWWCMNKDRAEKAEYIFAVIRRNNDIVQQVYKPQKWYFEDYEGKQRLVFKGVVAEETIRTKYINKKLPAKYCWKPGQANSFFYTYD